MEPKALLISEPPENWCEAKLEDVSQIASGGNAPQGEKYFSKGKFPFIRVRHFDGSTEYVKEWDSINSSAVEDYNLKLFPKNSIVFPKSGASILLEKRALLQRDSYVVGHLCVIQANEEVVNQKYLFNYLKLIRFSDEHSGSNMPFLNLDKIQNTQIPLPPLPEQNRIVEKLDQILPRLEACKSKVDKIPLILKHFRQGILSAACRGELTEIWRRKNKLNGEKTKIIIERIFKKRSPAIKRRMERIKLEPWDFNFEELIPDSWLEINFMEATHLITCGVAKRPDYVEKGIPFLSAQNCKPFKTNINGVKYISNNDFLTFTSGGKPEKNDVLYSRVGAKFGEAAKSTFDFDYAIYVSLTLIKPIHEILNPDYLVIFLNSEYGLLQAYGGILGSGIQNLNVENVRRYKIPLPPIEEQAEIVRRVEALFALADRLEAQYLKAKAKVDKLTQSVLAKAFRGELVPQDPSDEPATVLLERVKSFKENTTDSSQKLKRKLTKVRI